MASSSGRENESRLIPRSALQRVLRGVAVATKTPDDQIKVIAEEVSSLEIPVLRQSRSEEHRGYEAAAGLSFGDWRAAFKACLFLNEDSQQLFNLALAIAYMRELSRNAPKDVTAAVTSANLAHVWGLIREALTNQALSRQLCSASRTAQGFLAVPLCSLVEDGNISELFRLHVWLPDGQRGNADAIHSHQPFAQSWILAGEGRDHLYAVEPVTNPLLATHAEYALSWSDEKSTGTAYKTHQTQSIVVNTGDLMRVVPTRSTLHTRNETYSIPAAAFHRSEVASDILHATLFYFDSSRGFVKDARVLGPKDGESSTQRRDPAGATPAALASLVDAVRLWEIAMEQGRICAQRADWEHALRAYNSALKACESMIEWPNLMRHKTLVLGGLGNTNRRFGRYDQAKNNLEEALATMDPSVQHIKLRGELGVVYRQMNQFEDAKRAFQMQYDMAKQFKYEHGICRAVGNLGMVNYQLSQQYQDDLLLDLAIKQLTERVQSARRIKQAETTVTSSTKKVHRYAIATTWESIALSRLSLCYTARGNVQEAVNSALESLKVNRKLEDSTVIAMSRFYYGRALLLAGRKDEAMEQFNPRATCTPAIALCKEPSDEHRQYLGELVVAGADMDLVDDQGYKALDYAVFNDDRTMEDLVLEGLRRSLGGDVERKLVQRQTEARLRKGYRELFQEKLRPVLLGSLVPGPRLSDGILQDLRQVYAQALATDKEKSGMFDRLNVMQYHDFLRFGRLPRSGDGVVQEFMSELEDSKHNGIADFVIFFSYRWINKEPGALSPDDAKNSQYQRMIQAAKEFLRLHPSVKPERLGIWVVSHT